MGGVRQPKLEANKAYRIDGIVETSHPKYGNGEQATVTYPAGGRFRTQLPGKYLANFKPEMILMIKDDVLNGRNPYLVCRGQMLDNSYRIDILEKCK